MTIAYLRVGHIRGSSHIVFEIELESGTYEYLVSDPEQMEAYQNNSLYILHDGVGGGSCFGYKITE